MGRDGPGVRRAEALAGRLVSRVVPDDEVVTTARTLAAEIVGNTSGVSVALTRRMMWSMLGASSPWDAHRTDRRVIAALGAGPDAAEGVTAFLEKRPAEFTASPGDYLGLVGPWPPVPDDVVPPGA